MSDDTARAVGAGSTTTVMIDGKECTLRPLSIRELLEAERDCLKRYKREYISTFVENADLLPRSDRQKIIGERMAEAAKWDVDDLPPKYSYDPFSIQLTDRLRKWTTEYFPDAEKDDMGAKAIIATMLDQGTLEEKQYKEMVGTMPPKTKVGYVNWWITANYEGMTTLVWLCLRKDGITREQVVNELSARPEMLIELSREIESLSSPAVGNG